jgi:hypothetical protein
MDKKARNRIEIVLVERNRTTNWLAQTLDMNRTTISKWCATLPRFVAFIWSISIIL